MAYNEINYYFNLKQMNTYYKIQKLSLFISITLNPIIYSQYY